MHSSARSSVNPFDYGLYEHWLRSTILGMLVDRGVEGSDSHRIARRAAEAKRTALWLLAVRLGVWTDNAQVLRNGLHNITIAGRDSACRFGLIFDSIVVR